MKVIYKGYALFARRKNKKKKFKRFTVLSQNNIEKLFLKE